MAYIESLFRTDFILRIESHNKGRNDELIGLYRKIYNPALRPYTYSLKDVIFDNWKLYVDETIMSGEMQAILRSLPQYFDFRNWMAHGRYWRFRSNPPLRPSVIMHDKGPKPQSHTIFAGKNDEIP